MAFNPKPKSDPPINSRGLLLFLIAFVMIGSAFVFKGVQTNLVEEISFSTFSELLKNKRIISSPENPLQIIITEGSPTQTLLGLYEKEHPLADLSLSVTTEENPIAGEEEKKLSQTLVEKLLQEKVNEGTKEIVPFKTRIFMDYNGEDLRKELAQAGITPSITLESHPLFDILLSLLPFSLFLFVMYFIFASQMKMSSRGPLGFGKSKAKMLSKDNNKITFKDVAGVEEAKEEVSELVDFLKDPKKFQKLGGRIPKGVLMVGPPGTGKTLLARAIAGEADVPFFSISGSDFVEMFVGVGASRVRDMFEQGKKSAPCLIFIDEIDAVGRHRGGGMGGGHDEREQTLNALLVEMDGFDTQSGVIIIAATNRPDVLDPALLRPGRFDRQVTVDLPDIKGREQILNVHCRKIKLSDSVDLAVIARGTPGYSGAELANVVNEAALLAARKGRNSITMEEMEEARDKVRWGKERRSLTISDKEKEVTAYHEAGHTLLLEMLEHTEPLHKVTIIPRGPSLGSTMWLPKADRYNTRRKELLDHLVVIMGGRVAEDIVFGDVTSGAQGDIKQATGIARKMVCQWGMSEKLGMIEYGEGGEHLFLAKDFNKIRDYSESTAQAIDQEVKSLIDNAYERAKTLLNEHRGTLDLIANALLEYETLEAHQIQDLMKEGEMKNPPKKSSPPMTKRKGSKAK